MSVEIDLTGKSALVTGGGTGIGLGIATRLLDAGAAHMTLAGRRLDVLEAACGRLREGRRSASVDAVSCDVVDERGVAAAVAVASRQIGHLDIAIANAGIGVRGRVTVQSAQRWTQVLNTNVVGTAMTLKHASSAMGANGGAIVVISSQSAVRPMVPMASYTVSKAGIDTLVRCAALELAPMGIRVNGIRPGLVPNQLEMDPASEPYRSMLSRTPLGRMGTATEIGDCALFLVSALARWITGQVVNVCGGLSISDHDEIGPEVRRSLRADA